LRSICNGFGNRFLYACVRRSKLLPDGGGLDMNTTGLLGAETLEALTLAHSRGRIIMTPEANQLWRQVYPRLTAETPGLLGFVTARADPQTIRLALVYALLDRSTHIEKVHLEAALALWTYCEASARFIFGDFTGDPVADTILRTLRGAGSSGQSRWDISNMFGRNVPSNRIAEALAKLLATGKVRREMQSIGGPGRPREMRFIR
jgi:hypothetical protein